MSKSTRYIRIAILLGVPVLALSACGHPSSTERKQIQSSDTATQVRTQQRQATPPADTGRANGQSASATGGARQGAGGAGSPPGASAPTPQPLAVTAFSVQLPSALTSGTYDLSCPVPGSAMGGGTRSGSAGGQSAGGDVQLRITVRQH